MIRINGTWYFDDDLDRFEDYRHYFKPKMRNDPATEDSRQSEANAFRQAIRNVDDIEDIEHVACPHCGQKTLEIGGCPEETYENGGTFIREEQFDCTNCELTITIRETYRADREVRTCAFDSEFTALTEYIARIFAIEDDGRESYIDSVSIRAEDEQSALDAFEENFADDYGDNVRIKITPADKTPSLAD